ncbi:MAG: branched-chain amino acid ABC transporter permease [Xanthobacteraceae bacterium]
MGCFRSIFSACEPHRRARSRIGPVAYSGHFASRHGLALTAIRDSERASASLGVNNFRTKFIIYIATAACTGLIGSLIFLQKLRISPEAGFSINDWTVVVIFMVVIGGIGTLEGPFIGMLIFIVLRELLADYGTYYLILLGVIAIAVMLKAPYGIWGWVIQRFELQLFPVGRRLRLAPANESASTVPSEQAS